MVSEFKINSQEIWLIKNKLIVAEDDLRDFENSMTVNDSNGGWGPGGKKKINCCKVLMKKCLELIDTEASSVLACEDIEDLDVTTLRMIVCRETLCIQSESEVRETELYAICVKNKLLLVFVTFKLASNLFDRYSMH